MTITMRKFKVFYTLKRAALVEGESFVLPSTKEVLDTDSDDVNYAFLDIIEKHRSETVIGFEINRIKEIEELILQTV
jgi:hypothetical protein